MILNDLDITSSPSYAKDNGRPVVCLWGLGIREGTGEQYSELIDWFHDKGCYVIGGVSKSWRDQIAKDEAMEKAFCKLDMLSPWSVGSAKQTVMLTVMRVFLQRIRHILTKRV